MSKFWSVVFVLAAVVGLLATPQTRAADDTAAAPAKKLEVLVVAGGHPYAVKPFEAIFDHFNDMHCTFVIEKKGGEAFNNIRHWPYDAIVLYDYNKQPTDKEWNHFLELLDRGVGLTILHHAIYGYRIRPEYKKIVGVTSWLNGTQEGVDMSIHIADPDHPITQGLKDFEIKDEIYKGYTVEPTVHPLLTTETGGNGKVLSWVHTYRKSPVCYLQLGHGDSAYVNPHFIEYLGRAIRWTSGRPAAK